MQQAIQADVVIVGAGVAGTLAGWQLAQGGAKVVILEAGPPPVEPPGLHLPAAPTL